MKEPEMKSFKVAKTVGPHEVAQNEQPHPDLHCLISQYDIA